MHECFFVNTVVDWATKAIGIQHSRGRAAVFGYSCGGAFAASIGIRHPDVYGTVFAFSIAGRPITSFDAKPEADLSKVNFYFRSGSREPKGMLSYMKRLENWLRSADVQVNNETLAGGHEFALWSVGLNESIAFAYELTQYNVVNRSRRHIDLRHESRKLASIPLLPIIQKHSKDGQSTFLRINCVAMDEISDTSFFYVFLTEPHTGRAIKEIRVLLSSAKPVPQLPGEGPNKAVNPSGGSGRS